MKQRKHISLRTPIFISLIIVLIAGAGFVWWRWNDSQKATPVDTASHLGTAGADTDQTSGKPLPDAVIPNPTPNPDPNVPGGSTQSSSALSVPSGTFVNNHTPSLSDASRNQENSVCITAPGASCNITFTMGTAIKQLGAKAADDKGAASWDWTPQGVGLTAGTWQIQAIATASGQSKSTVDPIKLVVKP